VDIVSTIARPPFGPNMAAMQADATAAARSATARSNSRLGFVTSH
jgi:hypothetical protein